MDRRRFLKVVGLASGSLFAGFSFPWPADAATGPGIAYKGRLYKPGGKGKILVSKNGGRTWKTQTNFGNQYSVTRLSISLDRLKATVAYRDRTFPLFMAPDLKRWRTL